MAFTFAGSLRRGLAAGAAGGAVSALFVRFVTETQLGFALLFEEATGIGGAPGGAAEFSRGTQHWGAMAATLLYGLLLGAILGVAVAALHHRIASPSEFGRAARIATGAFVALVVIPGLKYPPNPPTVGDPNSIGQRTSDYLLLVGASIVVVFMAFFAWQWLTERGTEGASRFGAVGGGLVLAVVALYAIWPPSPDVIGPPDSGAAPALVVAEDAPPEVLDQVLSSARANDDGFLRDPAEPGEPLDLDAVDRGEDLVGVPAAISTSKLVDHSYTTAVWHFRMEVFAGLALMWAVIATVYGLLADRRVRAKADASVPAAGTDLAGA